LVIFLNHNTNRGGCWGYKLKDLTRLIDVRSVSDSQRTMVHYIIDYMEVAYSNDCDFYNELQPLEDVSNLQQLSFVQEELIELKNGISMVEEFNMKPSSNYGSFKDIMTKFIPSSKKLVEKIDELLGKGEKLFKEMVLFFGEAPSTTLEEFFGDITKFSSMFEKTRTDIKRKKELEARQIARQEQLEKQKQLQPKMPVGRLERALADLSSGNAYAKRAPNQAQTQQEQQAPNSELMSPTRRTVIRSTPNTPTNLIRPARPGLPSVQKDQLAAAMAFLNTGSPTTTNTTNITPTTNI